MGPIRMLMVVAAGIVLFSGHHYLLAYLLVFHLALEFLNGRKIYRALPLHGRYNGFFIAFPLFIVLARTRPIRFNGWIEQAINLIEHAFFAFTICLMLHCFIQLLEDRTRKGRPLLVPVLFNVIGVLNEIYQNLMMQRPALGLQADAWKDIGVNLVGSVLFVVIVGRWSTGKIHDPDRETSSQGVKSIRP